MSRYLPAASSRPMPNALGSVSSPASIRPYWRRALAPDGVMSTQTLILPFFATCRGSVAAFFGRPLRLPDWPRFQLVDRLPPLRIVSFCLFIACSGPFCQFCQFLGYGFFREQGLEALKISAHRSALGLIAYSVRGRPGVSIIYGAIQSKSASKSNPALI